MARPRSEGAGDTPGGSSGLPHEVLPQGQPQAQVPASPGPGCELQRLSL